MSFLLSWLVLSLAFLGTAWLFPGVKVKGFGGALVSAAVFGVLNALLGKLLFIVLGTITLGLGFLLRFITTWVVNVILLKVTDGLTESFELKTTGSAMVAAISISVLNAVLGLFVS